MSSLSNSNKLRHASSVRAMMESDQTYVYDKSSKTIVSNPLLPQKRVGSTRTTDGAAFVLDDESKVGKIVYYRDSGEKANVLREYRIGKQMGDAGVGPKVYTYYTIKTRMPWLVARNMLSQNVPGQFALFIIMENLAYNAKKLQTLTDYVNRGNPYPYEQVQRLKGILVKHGVLHGDLHSNNIMVKTRSNGSIRVYFIDFGRSLSGIPRRSERYLRRIGYTPHKGYPGYYNSPDGTPRGINQKILNRNLKKLGGVRTTRKTSSSSFVSIKNLFRTPSRRKTPTPKK